MNPKQVTKNMIVFNRIMFDKNFNEMNALHEQTERLVNEFWGKSSMLPEEGRNAISGWIEACKKGRDDFKKSMDENFKKVEEFFSEQK